MAQPPKKAKKDPDEDKKLKKGDIVTWTTRVCQVQKAYIGEVLSVLKADHPIEKALSKLNKYMTKPEIVGMDIQLSEKMKNKHKKDELNKQKEKKEKDKKINFLAKPKETQTSRPATSYIVTIKDKEGKDVLYWPRNSRLQLVTSP